jgi:hypothetical protein
VNTLQCLTFESAAAEVSTVQFQVKNLPTHSKAPNRFELQQL